MEPKYVVQTDLTLEEYEKYNKAINDDRKMFRIIQVVFTIWAVLSAISAFKNGDFFWVLFNIVFIIYVLFGTEYQTKKRIKEEYNQDCLLYGNVSTISFYEDHFETRNLVTHSSYDYSKLRGVTETVTNFYIMIKSNSGVIVQKKNCSNELIDFIKKLEK